MTLLVYLAKPSVGGWITFTAHLSLLKDYPIYKIGKRTEAKEGKPRLREFGYSCKYQNITIEDLLQKKQDILISAIDKSGYDLIDKFPEQTKIVIHDPTELKANKGFLLNYLDRFKIITIRKTVEEYLKKCHKSANFLYHPYVTLCEETANKDRLSNKSGAVSISRIDYDKHTEIILKANQYLLDPIEIYGTKNDRYVYHKLKDIDIMNEKAPSSNYRGRFPKDFYALANILSGAKYVVDMSRIKDDGGGSQYTFLEAIDFGCALILHTDWLKNNSTRFISGVNCFTVQNEDELVELLNSEPDTTQICQSAKLLLDEHLEARDW